MQTGGGGNSLRRRDVIAFLGVAAAWPLGARAQQQSKPLVGFLASGSSAPWAHYVAGFRRGLAETGFIDGQNVEIEYRWADSQNNRLPGLAADLVAHHVAAIFAIGGSDPGRAAKLATATVPIVFVSAADLIEAGLVASLNRPGANVTGISMLGSALEAKRLELLHEMVPKASSIGGLLNPGYPAARSQSEELQQAAAQLGVGFTLLAASTEGEIDAAFETFVRQGANALLLAQNPFFNVRRAQFIALAARHRLPVIYYQREFAIGGGLVSYGPNFVDGTRQAGAYVGRILKGEKPADLPVLQPTKFELVINLKTAKALGLSVPDKLIVAADEVIE